MKQDFIHKLKDKQVHFSENEKMLANLPEDLFVAFNPDMVTLNKHQHHWNEMYFNQKKIDLDFNFSKELVMHLIDVKKSFQTPDEQQEIDVQNQINQEKQKQASVSQESNSVQVPNLGDFRPNDKLLQFLHDGDEQKVRTYLMSMLNNKRLSLDELFKSIWYVHKNHPNVFESEKESAFVKDIDLSEKAWNAEYFNLQQVYLNKNFSLSRLLHLANVRHTLMQQGDDDFQQISVQKPLDLGAQDTKVGALNSKNTQTETAARPTVKQTEAKQHDLDNDAGFKRAALLVGGAVLAIAVALLVIL